MPKTHNTLRECFNFFKIRREKSLCSSLDYICLYTSEVITFAFYFFFSGRKGPCKQKCPGTMTKSHAAALSLTIRPTAFSSHELTRAGPGIGLLSRGEPGSHRAVRKESQPDSLTPPCQG